MELLWSAALSAEEGRKLAAQLFEETFGYQPQDVWSAPGRVNVIGEHVDYNGGPCLPIALPHRAFIAYAPREDRLLRLVSPQTREAVDELDLDRIAPRGCEGEVSGWAAYLSGVAWALEKSGYGPLHGFDAALYSCEPRCAMAVAIDEAEGLGLAGSVSQPNDAGRTILVECARMAENQIAGANTGGLDQTASLRCQSGHALALDCRDMSVEHIPFDLESQGLALLVIDTRAAHSLADGQYGQRRADCEEAARQLGVDQLVDVEDLEAATQALSEERLIKRMRHVVSEIARTRALIELLKEGPLEGDCLKVVGALMNDSHDSLRDDYEVSCLELDVAVNAARAAGAYGARMTGGGFGGSAIALVDRERLEETAQAVAQAYSERGLDAPAFIVAVPSAPAGKL